jgi:hypothetical protein
MELHWYEHIVKSSSGSSNLGNGEFFVVDTKPDEKLHQVVKGLFIGSQDAATNLGGISYHINDPICHWYHEWL